jgi:UDP-glucuronate 4-epimerase
MKTLVTGHAGFIGFHLAKKLLERGDTVVGFDVVNDYYDPLLKQARLDLLLNLADKDETKYVSIREDLADQKAVEACFAHHQFDRVIHLAAQAGVRYSLENPHSYVQSNLVAFTNILEACRHSKTSHLTYASTSSVYGANTSMPFSEKHGVDHPLQLYAATKRANELLAHSYSNLFQLPTTGLRFFTVYGPWGRPDMALFKFTKNIVEDRPIEVYNYGNHTRDFTYIDDIVEGILRASDDIAQPDLSWSSDCPNPDSSIAPFRIFNIGNNQPVKLGEYIEAIEEALGKKAIKTLLPLQPGDVPDTYADSTKLTQILGYKPSTSVKKGVKKFVEWYQENNSELPEKK